MQSRYRLKSRKSFTYIFNRGKAAHTGALTLVYSPTKYSLRFGFSASKKVGCAVVRNKVRRRLKEIVRAMIPQIKGDFNYIISVKPAAAEKDFAALKAEVYTLFKRAGALK